MRQKHYLEAVAQKPQASCPGQACYLLWACSSSNNAKNSCEETCPYCFQLLVLDNSRVHLKPKPKLRPKIQKLLNREAKNYTLSFTEATTVKKYKDSNSVLLITCKTCNRAVKHHGKSRSFLSSLKSSPSTSMTKPIQNTAATKTPSSANLNRDMSSSKGKSPALIFWTVDSHFLFLKEYEQNKETFLSTKNVASSARISKDSKDGLQKCLVFYVKNGFGE